MAATSPNVIQKIECIGRVLYLSAQVQAVVANVYVCMCRLVRLEKAVVRDVVVFYEINNKNLRAGGNKQNKFETVVVDIYYYMKLDTNFMGAKQN